MSRRPRRVFDHGVEPDFRFSLANQRTALAQIRTSLAMAAAGVVLTSLDLNIARAWAVAASVILLIGAILVAALAWFEWVSTETHMRGGGGLPVSRSLLVSIVTVSLALIMLLIGMIASTR